MNGIISVFTSTRSAGFHNVGSLQSGKRHPALVVADLAGDDLVLCQITRKARSDSCAVPLVLGDFERGRLAVDSFIRSAYMLLSIQYSMTGSAITRAVSAIRRQAQPGLGAMLVLTVALPQLCAQTLSVGPNFNINRQSGYQAEEAIAIDPTNPNRMFAWSNDLGNYNSAAFTVNGGTNWTSRFTGADGWPALGGDPTCTFDSFGNLFAASFNSAFSRILVRESNDAGSNTRRASSCAGIWASISSSELGKDHPTPPLQLGEGRCASRSINLIWGLLRMSSDRKSTRLNSS